jgi:hypothetical protein
LVEENGEVITMSYMTSSSTAKITSWHASTTALVMAVDGVETSTDTTAAATRVA